ncbi:uncharacterized protein LOC144135371 [Amblyomma americanum]
MLGAFTFQMGVVSYRMRDTHGNVSDAIYKPCLDVVVGDMSRSCQGTAEEIQPEKTMAAISDIKGKTYFYVFDSTKTMTDKAKDTMNSPSVREQFTWFLLNVHLTDFGGRCLLTPFERVTNFKTFFHQERAMKYG